MPQNILLVDDEPLNLDLLEQELTDLGYGVEKAESGRAALEKLAVTPVDLVLLDYQMPGMNGIEVLEEIKKKQLDLPVIMITAYGTIARAVEAIKNGADDFVTKPFDPDHLALVVSKALERARLKSEVELLTRELAGRYRLVAGKSVVMARVIDEAKKAASSATTNNEAMSLRILPSLFRVRCGSRGYRSGRRPLSLANPPTFEAASAAARPRLEVNGYGGTARRRNER